MRIALTGAAEGIDRGVLEEIVALRLFLDARLPPRRPDQATATEGRCFDAARLVVSALDAVEPGRWVEWEGVWLNDDVLAHLDAGGTVSASRLDEMAQTHGFAMDLDGVLVDITADQFGQAEVVATDNSCRRYCPRYESRDEMGDGDAWAREWAVVRGEWLARAVDLLPPVTGFRP